MNIINFIGLSIAVLFLAICFFGFIGGLYKSRRSVIWKDKNDSKNQPNSHQSFSYMGAFGGDAGAACSDGGGGGSCS